MDLIRKIFWVALTGFFTLCLVVLFENGTINFADNLQKEVVSLKTMMTNKPEKKKDADPTKP